MKHPMEEVQILKYLEHHYSIGPLPSWTEEEGDFILDIYTEGIFFEKEFPEMFEKELSSIFPGIDLKYYIIKWLARHNMFITVEDFSPPIVLTEKEHEELQASGKPLPKKFVTQLSKETISGWKNVLEEKRKGLEN